jgi:sugar phosphate isomerase/epimerase
VSPCQQYPESFLPLERSFKRRFPFPLACPSFIYRAGYVENVRCLAPYIDEIQLLFFESRPPATLPTPELIEELQSLANVHGITYNVHLPTDLFPGHPDESQRRHAADALVKILHCCKKLDPSTYTLHINPNPEGCPPLSVATWQNYLIETMEQVLRTGVPGRKISVENIDDDLEKVENVIRTLDLSVCMDLGHLMVNDGNIDAFYRQWKERISIVHLHGVNGGKDHLPLDHLSSQKMERVMEILSLSKGPLTVEVYSREALNASLNHLVDWLDNHKP